MARDFRRPERRQACLLPPDMQDWLSQDNMVHLVLDGVSLMNLSRYKEEHRVGGVRQGPFAPSMLLSLLIYAYCMCCGYAMEPAREKRRLLASPGCG